MYSAPNRILYAVFKPYDDIYNELIGKIKNVVDSVSELSELSRRDIEEAINFAVISICLGLYDNVAFFGASNETLRLINARKVHNTNHKIQNLMMEENSGSTESFVSKAISIKESGEDIFLANLVRLVVRKHLVLRDVDYRIKDRVAEKIFDRSQKKQLLVTSLNKKKH
jgi:hypothetical protein